MTDLFSLTVHGQHLHQWCAIAAVAIVPLTGPPHDMPPYNVVPDRKSVV